MNKATITFGAKPVDSDEDIASRPGRIQTVMRILSSRAAAL